MGSCLTNLACLFLVSDYRWERPNNAAVLRSDHFVDRFIDGGYLPSREDFRARLRWKPGQEREGERWLTECFRDSVGHLEISPDQPGLFATLASQRVDLVLMDNLHDTNKLLLHNRPRPGEPAYSLPFSLSHCDNEPELGEDFSYGPPLEAAASVHNWLRIIRFVQARQPTARIMFYCAHACTSVDLPDRHARTIDFHAQFAPQARELGVTVVPPLPLPPALTRMPEDRDHFAMPAYRALAGQIYLKFMLRQS